MTLEEYIKNEIKRYEVWAFLENHGDTTGFHSGYLQALRNTLAKLKSCEQLTLF